MNVVSLCLCYPSPDRPAAGLFVRRRLRALGADHHVRVICPIPAPFGFGVRRRAGQALGPPAVWYVAMPYVPALSQPINPFLYARAVEPLLSRWVADGEVDMLDAHFSWPDGVAAARLARRLGMPYSITLRGVLGRYAGDRFKRASIARALREADAVIAVSQSLKRIAVALGVSARRVAVIPNGIDPRTFHVGDRDTARSALGCDVGDVLLITVGHLSRRKGVHRVLRMLPRLIRDDRRIRYVVVGGDAAEGRFESHLKRLTRRLGICDHVTFTGCLPPEDVARWLRAADLFVLPTLNEGCCNAIREALASGLPVVTTDVGGNRESVHPRCGAVVAGGDDAAFLRAIRDRLDARPDRSAVAAAQPARSWQDVAQETAAALNTALTHAAVPAGAIPRPV